MKSEFIPSISSYIKYDFQDNCRKGFPIYNPNISSFYEYIFQMHLCVLDKGDDKNYGLLKCFRIILSNVFIITNLVYLGWTTGFRLVIRKLKNSIDEKRRIESTGVDIYVMINMILPILFFCLPEKSYCMLFLLFYSIVSMVMSYISIIFLSGKFREFPLNFQRSLLLLFFNYIQVIFSYAYFYLHFGQFSSAGIIKQAVRITQLDALFYSINPYLVSEIIPGCDSTKWVIITHDGVLFLLFGVAFVYFFNMMTSQIADQKAKK